MSKVSITSNPYAKWYSYVLGGVAFLALFDLKANGILKLNILPILFLALLVLVVVGIVKKQLKFKIDLLSVLFIVFYLLYAVYALFTRNPDQAGVYFENKLSFVLLPVLFAFRPQFKINQVPLIYGWILGCLALFGMSLIHSFSCYGQTSIGFGCFLSSLFSFQHHPTYTSFFYTFAFFLAIHAWKQKVRGFSTLALFAFCGLMLTGVFLCISLAGMLFFMLAAAFAVFLLIKRKWGIKWMVVSIVVSPIVLYGLIFSVPRLEGEWTNASWYAKEYLKQPKTYVQNCKPPHSGSQTRIIMWTVATDAFLDYPLGIGTGNVDEVLAAYQRKYNQEGMIPYQYNPHNQYLQTGLEIGVFGLLALVLIILVPFRQAVKQKNYLLLLVAGSLAFNSLFESMLQRQSGIFFYTFVLLILSFLTTSAKQSQNDEN